MKKKYLWLLCVPLLLLLTGCPLRSIGQVDYEIVYASGNARGRDTYNQPALVEGTDWQIDYERAADWEKSRSYDLLVLDGNGELLYTYPGLGSVQMRGEGTGAGTAWLCVEQWSTAPPYSCGYTSGDLAKSDLLLVDMADGSVQFQKELGENELFLTARGTQCYFYYCGNQEETGLFGLTKTPARDACIYYRDTENWEEAVLIYSFGYVEWLEEANSRLSHTFELHFYLAEDTVTVTATAQERPNLETQTWDEVEKASITIPLAELETV